ncbi:MAG: NAD(P)/FAD-dependent oxidoreductase [Pseudomonadales bacterium]
MTTQREVIVVGAGASGLVCAASAGNRGLDVLLLEKNPKAGLKILVSGGGRCNFTNVFSDPRKQFLSQNPQFCISAMSRYEPSHFIDMVEAHGISYHEKKLGQLFCDNSSKDIVSMLVDDCSTARVDLRVSREVIAITRESDGTFRVETEPETYFSKKVVIASGGLSLPKVASDLAFRTANRLGVDVLTPRAALVPLTWNSRDKETFHRLSGISVDTIVSRNGVSFRENILFTHRGLSGPAILQISSYWREGDSVIINLLPETDVVDWLTDERNTNPRRRVVALLKTRLPNRVVDALFDAFFAALFDAKVDVGFEDIRVGSCSSLQIAEIAARLNAWEVKPGGCEGYRTAEVTLGGIDTDEVSSKTFELTQVPGLFAIGEALDVTGWLGGYNFQWAWASGWCCAQHL